MLTMTDVHTRLDEVRTKTGAALRAAESDDGASVVLVAVVREFDGKAGKASQNAAESEARRTTPSSSWNRPGTAPRPRPRRTRGSAVRRARRCSRPTSRSASSRPRSDLTFRRARGAAPACPAGPSLRICGAL
ncbi:hypothetical protein GCM10009836_55410 [Pseudonocardia ailaonensis]|uniref:Uncharacterized protein n=1 Tax=Pseudonocardia ailaonensis TaxID=367279 RepID=A0ABN2NG48_9PSEU